MEEEIFTDWAGLPEELLLGIFNCLEKRDSRAARSTRCVCNSWRMGHTSTVTVLQPTSLARLNILQFCGLTELNLQKAARGGQPSLPPAVLASISCLPALTSLNVTGARTFNDSVMEVLGGGLHTLSTLVMDRCDFLSDRGAGFLLMLPSLTSLSMVACSQISNEGLSLIATLPTLRELNLSRCKHVDDRGLAALAENLTPLRKLSLAWNRSITNAGMLSIAQLGQLTELDLTRLNEVNSAGVAYLGFLPNLTSLNLVWCDSIDGMHLGNITALRQLNLSWSDNILDVGIGSIATLHSLTSLDLANCCKVTNMGFAALPSADNLQHLNLSYCKISDSALASLATLPVLHVLLIYACEKITDKGMRHLRGAAQLSHLSIGGCPDITQKGIELLLDAHPGLKLETRLRDDCSAHFAELALQSDQRNVSS